MIKLEKISYHGWPNCYRYSNNLIELIVTTDIGPRIIHYGWRGGENQLFIMPETVGQSGGDQWNLYGGHRLWKAPEMFPQSHFPDNHPIQLEEHAGFMRLVQPVETTNQIQKEMDIFLTETTEGVKIIHRLRNCSDHSMNLIPWGITALESGGVAVLPFQLNQDNPAPSVGLKVNVWDYTHVGDCRIQWRENCLLVRQDVKITRWLKMGLSSLLGVLGYLRGEHLFIKRVVTYPDECYPDGGSTVEVWTNDRYLELETLAPVRSAEPGQMVEHVEFWALKKVVDPSTEGHAFEERIVPILLKTN